MNGEDKKLPNILKTNPIGRGLMKYRELRGINFEKWKNCIKKKKKVSKATKNDQTEVTVAHLKHKLCKYTKVSPYLFQEPLTCYCESNFSPSITLNGFTNAFPTRQNLKPPT